MLIALAAATTGAGGSQRAARQAPLRAPATSVSADCSTDVALCMSDGRFLVDATWTSPDGASGFGHAVRLTEDSGYFWFLEPDNVELAVKTLNGCAVNGHSWFFAGGLTNLEVTIKVTDTTTGQTKTYSNPQGLAFLPIVDTSAFGLSAGAEAFSRNPEEPAEDDPASMAVPRRPRNFVRPPQDATLPIPSSVSTAASRSRRPGRRRRARPVPPTPSR